LATYQSKARPVSAYAFKELSNYYSAALLSHTYVVEEPRIPVPPFGEMGVPELSDLQNQNFRGITYMNTYFVVPGEASDKSLHFHELVHVLQWLYLGPDHFLMKYLLGIFEC